MSGLGKLEQNFSWYNPVEHRLVVPRRTESGTREAVVLDAHPFDVRRIIEDGATTLPEVAERLSVSRTVSEDVDVRGGRHVPLDLESPSPEALSLAASLEGNPCWVKGVNLRTTFLPRMRNVIDDYSEENYLSAELLDPRHSCVIYDVREFTNLGQLLYWRGHYVNEGGFPGASSAEVARFAREKLVEYADQTLDLIQERLKYPCDTFVVRISQRDDAQGPIVAGDYLVSGIGSLDAAVNVALGNADRSMTRVEDSHVDGTLLAYDDGALAQVRMAREADVSPTMIVPTTRPWVRLCVDRSLFDSRSYPTLVGKDFYRTYPDVEPAFGLDEGRPPMEGPEPGKGGDVTRTAVSARMNPGVFEGYLMSCRSAFLAEGGLEGLSPKEAISAFCDYVSSPQCPIRPPEPDHLRVRTPDGDLVAFASDLGDYRSIIVDLERADGNSGQVCIAEWVEESSRGPAMVFTRDDDGRVSARPGSDPIYPTPFHTFAFDGDSDEPAASVDLDPNGSEMWYSPRTAGLEEPDRNAPLSESGHDGPSPDHSAHERGHGIGAR